MVYYDPEEYESNVGYPGSFIPNEVQMRPEHFNGTFSFQSKRKRGGRKEPEIRIEKGKDGRER